MDWITTLPFWLSGPDRDVYQQSVSGFPFETMRAIQPRRRLSMTHHQRSNPVHRREKEALGRHVAAIQLARRLY